FTFIFFISIILSAVLAAFATPLVESMNYPGKENYVYWFAAILAIDASMAIPFARLRIQNKALAFATAKLINIGINISFNLFFLVFCKKVYEGDLFPSMRPLVDSIYDPAMGVGYVFLS